MTPRRGGRVLIGRVSAVPRPEDLVVGPWGARLGGRHFPCSVGRGGIGAKGREGDLVSPRGCWRITEVWARPDRRRWASARTIGLRDAWCDDPDDSGYNHPLLRDGPGEERLRRSDPLYDLVAVLDFNMDPVVPGRGSAIFLHGWRRPRYPTAGCVGFDGRDLAWILQRMGYLSPGP